MLEPRARTVDPAVLMEMLFRASDLETRFAMNMNVLIDGRTPQVSTLKEVLRAFLDHRREVLLRRSRFRLEKIDARLEVLEGLLVAYLNLDRVIEIIRTEDEPKPVMIAEFALTDVQAEAILNMRLRNLRKLEEMEIRARARRADRRARRARRRSSPTRRRSGRGSPRSSARSRKAFGKDAPGGARRTTFDDAPEVEEVSFEAMIEREPITVVCSEMGWIRAMKGHLDPAAELKFKDGDGPRFFLHAETTDRLLLFASNGRMYTLACAALPGGRGMGEPVRLMIDLPNEAQHGRALRARPGRQAARRLRGRRRLRPARGRGGGADPRRPAGPEPEGGRARPRLPAGRRRPRRGRRREPQAPGLPAPPSCPRWAAARASGCSATRTAASPTPSTFDLADGLAWKDPAGRTRTVGGAELAEWIGARASAGRMAPRGFPRENRFD